MSKFIFLVSPSQHAGVGVAVSLVQPVAQHRLHVGGLGAVVHDVHRPLLAQAAGAVGEDRAALAQGVRHDQDHSGHWSAIYCM